LIVNTKAVELALKARDISKKNILVAGGLPNQYQTYNENLGDDLSLIEKNFYDQAKLLKSNIDFFYLDVMGSGKECEIALKTIKSFNLPVLVGVHIRKNGKLPSGENISDIVKKYKEENWLGIIAACVHPESYEIIVKELKNLEKETSDNYRIETFSRPRSYISKGLYARQLQIWFDLFPKENILITSTEEMAFNPQHFMNKIFDFLNISKYDIKNPQKRKSENYPKIKSETRKLLIEYFKPYNEELYKLIGKSFDWDK